MLTLDAIVKHLGGELLGSGATTITGIAPLLTAQSTEISFLANPRYASQLSNTRAACVIVHPAQRDAAMARGHCIVTDQPYLYFAKLTQMWKHRFDGLERCAVSIHPSAVISETARVDPSAVIGPFCVVEAGAVIGAHTRLKSHVTISSGCVIGERCTLHAGVVIGADGFGFVPNPSDGEVVWEKIEQLGSVCIGNDVEIGANTCIDRGALGDTIIEDGVKIDNLVQIAHNVRIGKHSAIAGSTGIAGSAVIGAHCTVGGAAKIAGHLTIADHVHISGGSQVMRSIPTAGLYTGYYPLATHADWSKNAAALRNLAQLRTRVRVLESELEKFPEMGKKTVESKR